MPVKKWDTARLAGYGACAGLIYSIFKAMPLWELGPDYQARVVGTVLGGPIGGAACVAFWSGVRNLLVCTDWSEFAGRVKGRLFGSEQSLQEAPPGIRWQRGLLRLWLVGSAAWLLLTASMTGFGSVVLGIGQGFPTLADVPAWTQAQIDRRCPMLPDGKIDFDCRFDPEIAFSPITRDVAWKDTKAFLYVGFSVPLVVLAVGALAGWVVSGFRPAPPRRHSDS